MALQHGILAQDERTHFAQCMARIGQERCRRSFAEIFEYFAPRLKSYLIRLGSDPLGAEEIIQEVMMNVWRKANQYDPKQASVSTWIFRIARNRRIDAHRRTAKPELDPEDPLLRPPDTDPPEIIVNRQQVEVIVRRELETLPEEQLTLLQAAFYDGLSHSEIAKRYDLPLGTVKSRIRLAFQRLKNSLTREH